MNRTRILGIVLAVVLALGGAVALTGYVGTADARALAGTKLVPAYVAKTVIPTHTSGGDVAQYLAVKQIPAVAALSGRVTSLDELKGLESNASIEPGEQLVAARWSAPPKKAAAAQFAMAADMEAVTVALPVQQAVGGQLQAGDTVGVIIASGGAGKAGQPSVNGASESLATQKLHNVKVLKVQQGATIPASAKSGQPSTAPVDTEM